MAPWQTYPAPIVRPSLLWKIFNETIANYLDDYTLCGVSVILVLSALFDLGTLLLQQSDKCFSSRKEIGACLKYLLFWLICRGPGGRLLDSELVWSCFLPLCISAYRAWLYCGLPFDVKEEMAVMLSWLF